MQNPTGHPVPLAHNGSGAGQRNARPINAQGQGQQQQHVPGVRNRSGTGGNANQFEAARSPPNNKSESQGVMHGARRRKFTDKQAQDLRHVPCKFFRVGQCQAGNACPFSHDFDHGEQPCKYFAKGNCKFGPKCANLHVDQFGRVLNRKEKNLSSYNLGGRNEALAYQQQAAAMGVPLEEIGNGPALFNNQIPPLTDLEGSVPIPQSQPYDIPGSQTQYGSPPEDGRFPMSPPLLRNMNEVGLPSSFDSKGSSTFFKHGPIAASVPSKFSSIQSPPSSAPRQSMLTSEAMHKIDSSKSKPAAFGSSPGFLDDEPSAPRMLHSQQRHKPRGVGVMSTSLPVQEEWEKDDDGFFADEQDYIPSELLNSQIHHKDDRETSNPNGQAITTASGSAPRDFVRRDSIRNSNGFGSPDLGPKWGSPSMASPGSSRFMGLFAEQKRNQEQANGAQFGPVGSPRRSSIFGSSPNAFGRSPPVSSGVSGITLGLRDMQTGSSEKSLKPMPAAPPRRLPSDPRTATNRTVSSSSVSQRIDEEPQDFAVFAMEADDLNAPSKDKIPAGPWGQPMSPSFGPVGAGRKSSMSGKNPNDA